MKRDPFLFTSGMGPMSRNIEHNVLGDDPQGYFGYQNGKQMDHMGVLLS